MADRCVCIACDCGFQRGDGEVVSEDGLPLGGMQAHLTADRYEEVCQEQLHEEVKSAYRIDTQQLRDLLLSPRGVLTAPVAGQPPQYFLCTACLRALKRKTLPKFP